MQIKTMMRYHLTPVRTAIIKKIKNNNVGKDAEKRESLYTVGGNVSDVATVENSMEVFQKK